jgi:hypothetical protein
MVTRQPRVKDGHMPEGRNASRVSIRKGIPPLGLANCVRFALRRGRTERMLSTLIGGFLAPPLRISAAHAALA